jgi:hypothetical protein
MGFANFAPIAVILRLDASDARYAATVLPVGAVGRAKVLRIATPRSAIEDMPIVARGTPRASFGSISLMAAHSWWVSS